MTKPVTLFLFLTTLFLSACAQTKTLPRTAKVFFDDRAYEDAKKWNKEMVDLSLLRDDEWCYPLPGAKVISEYGSRGRQGHSGVDLKTKPNDPIYAVFDGVVTMSQRFEGYGNCIILRHANGLETLYSHNSKNLVKVGEHVHAGQKIALTGRTGRATTEHLHFEVRVQGKHYNPNILFDYANCQLKRHRLVFTKGGGVTIH